MNKPYREALGDLDALPEELKAQLTTRSHGMSWRRQAIFDVIEACGGTASINEIVVGLYRQAGEIRKRTTVLNMVATMVKAGLLFHGGHTGVYTTKDPAKSPPVRAAAPVAAKDTAAPTLSAADRKRAQKAYELLKGKVSLPEVAVQIGIGFSPEQCETLARQYAGEAGKPWPV